jgi:predicted DNA binding protein
MSTIVEASVPAAQFALQETVQRLPDAVFEAVRVATGGTDGALPLLWGSGVDQQSLTAALEADESIGTVRVCTRLHEASLYSIEWTTRVRVVTQLLVANCGTILSARAHDGRWTFCLLFPRRDAVAAIVESCDRFDVDLRIERISSMTERSRADRSDLTDEQLQTVETALERGYYDVPRETTLTALSEELGVSHQALSERLRRGHRRLVETALGSRIDFDSQS